MILLIVQAAKSLMPDLKICPQKNKKRRKSDSKSWNIQDHRSMLNVFAILSFIPSLRTCFETTRETSWL